METALGKNILVVPVPCHTQTKLIAMDSCVLETLFGKVALQILLPATNSSCEQWSNSHRNEYVKHTSPILWRIAGCRAETRR